MNHFPEGVEGDIELVCIGCGDRWLWTIGNQLFYLERGFATPKRCPQCSRARRERLQQERQHG